MPKKLNEKEAKLSLINRFHKKYKKAKNGCWEWMSSKNIYGYGQLCFRFLTQKKMIGTHRLSYEIHRGKIPEGLIVCHTCDKPSCVNPDHLFLGTQADNLKDMINKKRDRFRGSQNAQSKLTESEVYKIKLALKENPNQRQLARKYNVSFSIINRIKLNKTWKHVVIR